MFHIVASHDNSWGSGTERGWKQASRKEMRDLTRKDKYALSWTMLRWIIWYIIWRFYIYITFYTFRPARPECYLVAVCHLVRQSAWTWTLTADWGLIRDQCGFILTKTEQLSFWPLWHSDTHIKALFVMYQISANNVCTLSRLTRYLPCPCHC